MVILAGYSRTAISGPCQSGVTHDSHSAARMVVAEEAEVGQSEAALWVGKPVGVLLGLDHHSLLDIDCYLSTLQVHKADAQQR